jgi:hypothetical protein
MGIRHQYHCWVWAESSGSGESNGTGESKGSGESVGAVAPPGLAAAWISLAQACRILGRHQGGVKSMALAGGIQLHRDSFGFPAARGSRPWNRPPEWVAE